MQPQDFRRWQIASALAAVLLASPVMAADALPLLDARPESTSVSGISSGAYIAGQFQVAFSSAVIGAAILAGGPYGCSEGMVSMALARCMSTEWGKPDAAALVKSAQALAESGRIDPLTGLADDRIYLFSGTRDETVIPDVVSQAVSFYRLAGVPGPAIKFVGDMAAGHAFIIEGDGNACGISAAPTSTTAITTRQVPCLSTSMGG